MAFFSHRFVINGIITGEPNAIWADFSVKIVTQHEESPSDNYPTPFQLSQRPFRAFRRRATKTLPGTARSRRLAFTVRAL